MPPAPVRVTSREPLRSSSASSATSAPRPTSGVSGAGRCRRARTLGRLDGERRIVPEDRLLQLLQRGPRLEAELVLHRLACPPERVERRRLPIAPVEGEHQLPAEPLAAPVL